MLRSARQTHCSTCEGQGIYMEVVCYGGPTIERAVQCNETVRCTLGVSSDELRFCVDYRDCR